jgi:hypothetical protein
LTRKVLIIDDEKPTLAMFELFLEAYGFEVLTAEKGEEGIEVFEAENPSIVFTDIKMPGIDGFEVLKRIKTHFTRRGGDCDYRSWGQRIGKRALDLKQRISFINRFRKKPWMRRLKKRKILKKGLLL